MKTLPDFYISEGLRDPVEDSLRLQKAMREIASGLSGRLTLTENLQTQLLSVDFTTPQTASLAIQTKFNVRPLWVELLSFSRVLPVYTPLSLGASFRWSWGKGEVVTDTFLGIPQDNCKYNVTLLAFFL